VKHIQARTFVYALFFFVCCSWQTQILAVDTNKILQMNVKALELSITDSNGATSQLLKALQLSERGLYTNGVILSLSNLGFIQSRYGDYRNALHYYNRAMSSAKKAGKQNDVAKISIDIGKTFHFLGDIQNAIFYFSQAEFLFSQADNHIGLYDVYQEYSILYQTNNDYYQALHYGLKAYDVSKSLSNEQQIVMSLANLGQIYALLNQKTKAIEHYIQAIQIAESLKDITYLPILYLNAGAILRENGQFDEAITFYLRANNFYKQNDNLTGVVSSLTELGKTNLAQNKLDKALNYFMRAKLLAEQENNFVLIINLNYEIASAYVRLGSFNKALLYLDRNYTIARNTNDIENEAQTLMKIGHYLLLQGRVLQSKETLLKSLVAGRQTNRDDLLSEMYSHLAKVEANLENFKAAYDYMDKSKVHAIRFFEFKEADTFQTLELIFELSNKQKDLEILKKSHELERVLKEQAIAVKRNLTYGAVILLFLLVAAVFMVFYIRKKNKLLVQKTNEISASNKALVDMNLNLEDQKKQLNKLNNSLIVANEKLKKSEEDLTSLNSTKDKLFSIIAHDLRSPFASVVSFTRLIKRDITKLKKHEIQTLTQELEKTTDQIYYLLENLLQWSMSQTGKIRFQAEPILLSELIEDAISLFSSHAASKKVRIIKNFDPTIQIIADKSMISAVFRNLISNALKFSPKGEQITINAEKTHNKIQISIIDNGVGMNEEQVQNLFNADKNKSTHGTESEKGSGLGLLICNEFLLKHNTKIKVTSTPNKGSIFSFSLQLAE
jgi:signal transduction histidine kinase